MAPEQMEPVVEEEEEERDGRVEEEVKEEDEVIPVDLSPEKIRKMVNRHSSNSRKIQTTARAPAKKAESSVTSSSSSSKQETDSQEKSLSSLTSEATKTITQLLKRFTSTTVTSKGVVPPKRSTTTSVADSTQSVSSSGSVDLSFSADAMEEEVTKELNEEDIESSAVDLYNKNSREKYLKKLYHQERVVEEVKLALKPFYQKKEVTKDEFKDIMRKAVHQVSHSKSGEINPVRIRSLVEGYVKKFQYYRKHSKKPSSVKTLVNKGKDIGLK
ncbi:putative PHD and RING finger domain-containin g protein 1 [Apostichopus japonicus]|uniref:Putative PHD and RING finger domain-containin g protein 1 n=1 Tax=Stichopus japonicus TaxID=307972 RepID=A0A2G8KL05_STIJA|nr:putative PHD and RING finger domain-containin g protein 1 [Apostichopus japonicus]